MIWSFNYLVKNGRSFFKFERPFLKNGRSFLENECPFFNAMPIFATV